MSTNSSLHMSESQIQAEIVAKARKYPGVTKCFSIPNEGAGGNKVRNSLLIRTGLLPGVSDLEIWLANGWTLYAEVKDPKKWKQSDRQIGFEEAVKKEPARIYRIVFSWKDAEAFIRQGLTLPHVIRKD